MQTAWNKLICFFNCTTVTLFDDASDADDASAARFLVASPFWITMIVSRLLSDDLQKRVAVSRNFYLTVHFKSRSIYAVAHWYDILSKVWGKTSSWIHNAMAACEVSRDKSYVDLRATHWPLTTIEWREMETCQKVAQNFVTQQQTIIGQ